MTECIYQRPITSFNVETKPQPVFEVDISGRGRSALEAANDDLGETLFKSVSLRSALPQTAYTFAFSIQNLFELYLP